VTFVKGKPKTGGRKPGVKNLSTRRREETLQELMASKAGADPLEFWFSIMSDPNVPYDIRMVAARDLAPYARPKLASIEARTGGKTHEDRLAELHKLASEDD